MLARRLVPFALPSLLAACNAGPVARPARVPHVIEAALRPDDPSASGLLYRFDPSDDVEHYDSAGGHIRVHFTRAGDNAVRAVDVDQDGTPDDVVVVADTYEEVLANEATLGFREPASDVGTPGGDGGNARFDVYLVDFAGAADGTFVREHCGQTAGGVTSAGICSGYMVQENDYAGYPYPSFRVATRILSSHELFHAVQAAYDDGQGANWTEATAVWATEHFDASLNDFEGFIGGWFERPDRSIDTEPTGPVDAYSYGLAIFVEYLSQRFGDGIVREIWEDSVDGANGVADPHWLEVLAARLASSHQSTFPDAWDEFARWVALSSYGGPAGTTWANAGFYPEVAKTAVTLPASVSRPRVFHASLKAWSGDPGGRAVVRAELVVPDADAAELEGLTLTLTARKGGSVTVVRASQTPMAAGPMQVVAEVPTVGANEVVAIIANGLTEGGSKRPSLCLGSAEEVADCKAAILAAANPEAGPEAVEAGPEEAAEVATEAGPEAGPEAEPSAETAASTEGEASAEAVAEPARGGDEGCAGGQRGLEAGAIAIAAAGVAAVRGHSGRRRRAGA